MGKLELKLDTKRIADADNLESKKRLVIDAALRKTKLTQKQLLDKKNLELKLSAISNTSNPNLLIQTQNDIISQKAAAQKKILNDKNSVKKQLDSTAFNIKMSLQNKPC
jgi:hypothetical protein